MDDEVEKYLIMFRLLNLKNFKCFRQLIEPIEFTDINLLTGSNGRGKSSIFQSILLLAQSYESGKDFKRVRLSGRFLELGSFKDIVYKGDLDEKITISISTDDENDQNIKFICKAGDVGTVVDNIYVNDKSLVSETSSASSMGNSCVDSPLPLAVKEEKSFSPTSTYESFSQFLNVFYISADRLGPLSVVKLLEDSVGDQIGVHGEKIINSLHERRDDFQHTVATEMSHILGGASVRLTNLDTDFIRVFLDSIDGSNGYRPINVGFGYSYILPLIVFPLVIPEGSKLFIENPEAHLHPGAQSRLSDFLIRISRERKIQLFIETHSDHIINSLRIAVKRKQYGIGPENARIIHIGRQKESNEPMIWQIQMDSNGRLSDYPPDFFEEWGNQMAQLV